MLQGKIVFPVEIENALIEGAEPDVSCIVLLDIPDETPAEGIFMYPFKAFIFRITSYNVCYTKLLRIPG